MGLEAARSLGRIGARTGDWSLTALVIERLDQPALDIAVQIELVRAIGRIPTGGRWRFWSAGKTGCRQRVVQILTWRS